MREGEIRRQRDDEGTGAEPTRGEYVWIDDALPAGAKPSSDGGVERQMELRRPAEAPRFQRRKGVDAHGDRTEPALLRGGQARPAASAPATRCSLMSISIRRIRRRRSCFSGTPANWRHRAYWGENVIPWGRDKSAERRHIGPLPKKGEWVRLEVDAAKVGLKPGTVINGWAFTQLGGTVYWDKAGIVTRTPQGRAVVHQLDGLASRAASAAAARVCRSRVQQLVKLPRAKRNESQKKQLRDYFLEHAYAKAPATLAPLQQTARRISTRNASRSRRPCRRRWCSRSARRRNRRIILKRGEYDQRGETGRPRRRRSSCRRCRKRRRRDRLGLAQWLLAPDHPLTARVEVNRLWQQCFGTGLVKTAEDFGYAGRIAEPSAIARLAGGAVPRRRLGHQEDDETPRDVRHLSAVVAGDEGSAGEGSAQSVAVARPAFPSRRRDAARSGVVRQRPAGGEAGRSQRQAAAAVRLVGGGRVTPAATRRTSSPITATRRCIAAACTRSGSAPRRRRR